MKWKIENPVKLYLTLFEFSMDSHTPQFKFITAVDVVCREVICYVASLTRQYQKYHVFTKNMNGTSGFINSRHVLPDRRCMYTYGMYDPALAVCNSRVHLPTRHFVTCTLQPRRWFFDASLWRIKHALFIASVKLQSALYVILNNNNQNLKYVIATPRIGTICCMVLNLKSLEWLY